MNLFPLLSSHIIKVSKGYHMSPGFVRDFSVANKKRRKERNSPDLCKNAECIDLSIRQCMLKGIFLF